FANEEIKIAYVPFMASDFKNKVHPSKEQLQAYYEEHKDNYMTDPQVKLHFLVFPFAADATSIPDDTLESYYRQNISQFSTPEQRKARHILIKTSQDDSTETLKEKRKRAEQILELAKSGEDFGALAKQYSEGPSGPKGGDLGTFSRGQMIKPFEDAVFAMKEGEISDIVKTPFGFHIIKLEKIEPAHTRTFAEVKGEIETRLKKQRAQELAFTQATEAYENIIRAGSLDKYGQESNITIEQTNFFPRNAPTKSGSKVSMVSDPAFLNAAFALNNGELSSLVETPEGYAIIFAADKKEPEVASYQDVADQVEKDYVQTTADTMAKEAAESMLATLKEKNGKDFTAVAAKLHMSPKSSDFITRSAAAGANIPTQVVNIGFELSAEHPYPADVVAADGIFYVFKVLEKRPPAANLFSEKESAFKAGLLEREKSSLLAAWLANVRSKAKIEINQQFL
ncbi:MAG: peptidylprolyl isomerase, partial [Desulfobulbales bacterium]